MDKNGAPRYVIINIRYCECTRIAKLDSDYSRGLIMIVDENCKKCDGTGYSTEIKYKPTKYYNNEVFRILDDKEEDDV